MDHQKRRHTLLQVAYTIAEAAATTATDAATIVAEIRAGRLRVRIAGSTKVILHTDLIEWADALLDANRPRPVPATQILSVAT